jgi:hypothetical protein
MPFFMMLGSFVLGCSVIMAQSQSNMQTGQLNPTINDLLKLTVTGNGYSDQTIVVFVPDATPGFDPEYDAYKLMGIIEAPQLYSIIPGINLAINALPQILVNLEVQLGFKVGVINTYTITATELTSFDPSVTIFLDDTRDNVLTDLVANPVYSFTAKPIDDIERFKLYFRYPVYPDLTVFLEGCFEGTEMNNDLNLAGFLPLSQPFNTEPWNYSGTESVAAIPNSDVVDWVLIEIRDTTDVEFALPATRAERAAGFLLKNGSVTALDGISNLMFTETIYDSIFITVWHRNHLGIISANPVTESGGVYSYDFSTSADKAFGGVLAQKDLVGGIFGMITGDSDANGVVNENDKAINWSGEAGNAGYLSGDIDLNGQADNPDKNDLWLSNQSAECQVPE